MTAAIILTAVTVFLLFATGISFARIAHGFVRVFAFPRLQFLALTLVLVPLTVWLVAPAMWMWSLLAGQAIVLVVQAVSIAQFTPRRKRQSQRYQGDPNGKNTVSVLSYNVKMSNRDYDRAIELVRDADPDIAIFMETDEAWARALKPLSEGRPHSVSHPLENSYGMVLMSRHELRDTKVQYLVMEGVPSIITTVVLPDDQSLRLFCVHPEPPVPHVDSAGRDAELVTVAKLAREDPMPAIVCGDLNDVAWSHTTRLFQRISRLLDPRVGRGFYNTFDTRFWFMRWPLDHLFHDARLHLIAMKRLPDIGSDHYPMYFKLALTASADEAELPEAADATDREECAEIERDAREVDRDAIGTDWEK
ncbi:endonuclease/exonuclease/phosphatase family protein [Aurantimonas sp. A3-2-R12]|uniref:endonuclease/exonuclease/phosphatase family protein n=1 Tax=Aurantimonas sp. A3-2-R12 TaxID=3114362 RepID=UPI002E186FDD|nr:endonuclease/exonuclease/phosphatase family protein [Aurantimonas sp. A3-2-R12]